MVRKGNTLSLVGIHLQKSSQVFLSGWIFEPQSKDLVNLKIKKKIVSLPPKSHC
jgi:hypothetical protein